MEPDPGAGDRTGAGCAGERIAPGPVLPPPEFTEKQIAATAKHTLLGRWGSAEDVAQAVVFLVQAAYVTGVVIPVDGGERLTSPVRSCEESTLCETWRHHVTTRLKPAPGTPGAWRRR